MTSSSSTLQTSIIIVTVTGLLVYIFYKRNNKYVDRQAVSQNEIIDQLPMLITHENAIIRNKSQNLLMDITVPFIPDILDLLSLASKSKKRQILEALHLLSASRNHLKNLHELKVLIHVLNQLNNEQDIENIRLSLSIINNLLINEIFQKEAIQYDYVVILIGLLKHLNYDIQLQTITSFHEISKNLSFQLFLWRIHVHLSNLIAQGCLPEQQLQLSMHTLFLIFQNVRETEHLNQFLFDIQHLNTTIISIIRHADEQTAFFAMSIIHDFLLKEMNVTEIVDSPLLLRTLRKLLMQENISMKKTTSRIIKMLVIQYPELRVDMIKNGMLKPILNLLKMGSKEDDYFTLNLIKEFVEIPSAHSYLLDVQFLNKLFLLLHSRVIYILYVLDILNAIIILPNREYLPSELITSICMRHINHENADVRESSLQVLLKLSILSQDCCKFIFNDIYKLKELTNKCPDQLNAMKIMIMVANLGHPINSLMTEIYCILSHVISSDCQLYLLQRHELHYDSLVKLLSFSESWLILQRDFDLSLEAVQQLDNAFDPSTMCTLLLNGCVVLNKLNIEDSELKLKAESLFLYFIEMAVILKLDSKSQFDICIQLLNMDGFNTPKLKLLCALQDNKYVQNNKFINFSDNLSYDWLQYRHGLIFHSVDYLDRLIQYKSSHISRIPFTLIFSNDASWGVQHCQFSLPCHSGCYYFEQLMLTNECAIGWTLKDDLLVNEVGQTLNANNWQKGDVIGCFINFNLHEVGYTRNGTLLKELTIRNIKNAVYYPTISLFGHQSCEVRLGNHYNSTDYKGYTTVADAMIPYSPTNHKIYETRALAMSQWLKMDKQLLQPQRREGVECIAFGHVFVGFKNEVEVIGLGIVQDYAIMVKCAITLEDDILGILEKYEQKDGLEDEGIQILQILPMLHRDLIHISFYRAENAIYTLEKLMCLGQGIEDGMPFVKGSKIHMISLKSK